MDSTPLLQSRHVPSIPGITRARQPLVFYASLRLLQMNWKIRSWISFMAQRFLKVPQLGKFSYSTKLLYAERVVNCSSFSHIQTSVSHIAGANRLIGVFRIALANTLSNIFVIKSTFHCPLSSWINWSIVSRFSENSSGFWRGCGCNNAQQSSQIWVLFPSIIDQKYYRVVWILCLEFPARGLNIGVSGRSWQIALWENISA